MVKIKKKVTSANVQCLPSRRESVDKHRGDLGHQYTVTLNVNKHILMLRYLFKILEKTKVMTRD